MYLSETINLQDSFAIIAKKKQCEYFSVDEYMLFTFCFILE